MAGFLYFFWVHGGSVSGGELAFVYFAVFVLMYLAGPGKYSVDSLLGARGKEEDDWHVAGPGMWMAAGGLCSCGHAARRSRCWGLVCTSGLRQAAGLARERIALFLKKRRKQLGHSARILQDVARRNGEEGNMNRFLH